MRGGEGNPLQCNFESGEPTKVSQTLPERRREREKKNESNTTTGVNAKRPAQLRWNYCIRVHVVS